jgi:murein DD-endopeptidase MepM/ murein hydrolase activator NlpD
MKQKPTNILGGAGFYAVLAACLIAVGAASWFWLFRDRPGSAETGAASSAQADAPADLPADNQDAVVPEQPKIPGVPAKNVSAPAPAKPAASSAPDLVVSPLNGTVLSAFSMDSLAYDKTLDDWRTHNGVDISAGAGTKVQSASAGTVKSVENDPLMGTTVTVTHTGGYQTVYANLEAQPTVKAGDSVSAGQILGAVGSTSIVENAEGPHLHFSVLKDGQPVNPETFLKK